MKTGLDTITLWVRQICRSRFFILSPKCIHIYNELNIGLALYCVIKIVNVELSAWWSWKRHTGRFLYGIYFEMIPFLSGSFEPCKLSPFSIWQNIGLNRGGGHWQLPWIMVAVWGFPKWERTYWEAFSMHFRNYPLNDIDNLIAKKSAVRFYPHI